jgi:hypothetical protein
MAISSAVNVQKSSAETGQLDSETVLNNAELQAYGYRVNATSEEAQSGLLEQEAEEAPIGAALSAGGGLLSSASSIGFKFTNGGGNGNGNGSNVGAPLNIVP